MNLTFRMMKDELPADGSWITWFSDDPTEIFYGEVSYEYIDNDPLELLMHTGNGIKDCYILDGDPPEGCSKFFSISVNGHTMLNGFWMYTNDIYKEYNTAMGEILYNTDDTG